MAVTGEVWEEAHEYHRLNQNLHALFNHGPGIVTGLDIIASDPPDTSIYILPGIAVDPLGQTIVLPQPVAYDIGHELEGLVYILISYGESRPKRSDTAKDSPLYIHTEFSIFARTTLPVGPWVELARVRRESRDSVFLNAKDPAQPGLNEIDLRYRREIGAPKEGRAAVCYLGQAKDRGYGLGTIYLTQTLNHSGRYQFFVEDDAALAPGIETNTLIYLVGQGEFELNRGQMNGLYNYVQKGRGTLLTESVDSESESIFLDILKTMGLELKPISPGHRLLVEPHLFSTPPPGFDPEDTSEILVTDGVIFSQRNYGRLWRGELLEGKPAREQIRSAIEWGENIITYAVRRRR